MSNESRRKLLKSITAGSGAIVAGKSLPESWSRPVVDSVMLPAHAQTSPPAPSSGPFAGSVGNIGGAIGTNSIFAKASDSLIPQAQAQGLVEGPVIEGLLRQMYVCVTPNSSLDGATVKAQLASTRYTFMDVSLDGSKCNPQIEHLLCEELPEQRGDSGGFLNDLGLLNDAHAGPPPQLEFCCYLDSVTGTGAGRFEFSTPTELTVYFDVDPNPCDMPDPCQAVVGDF